jgi:hypothetical protein
MKSTAGAFSRLRGVATRRRATTKEDDSTRRRFSLRFRFMQENLNGKMYEDENEAICGVDERTENEDRRLKVETRNGTGKAECGHAVSTRMHFICSLKKLMITLSF